MLKEGVFVKGKITGIKDYGAFAKVEDRDGLVHISEFSDGFVKDINEIVKVGEEVELKVIGIDEETGRLKLSFKQAKNIPIKIKKIVPISIGFKSLEENMPSWINIGYQKFNKK